MDSQTIDTLYAIGGLTALALGGLLWLINTRIKAISHETSPNSGSSMKDVVGQIYSEVRNVRAEQAEWRTEQNRHNDRLYDSVARVHKRLDDHISDHLNGVDRG